MTNTFLENDHPRTGDGTFTYKTQTAPEAELLPQRTPGFADDRKISSTLVREVWQNDDAVEVGQDGFDARAVFDSMSIDDIEIAADQHFESILGRAIDAGEVDDHDGPFTVRVDDEDFEDYVAARRGAGQDQPVVHHLALSPRRRAERIGEALRAGYERFPVPAVLDAETVEELRAMARNAAASIEDDLRSRGLHLYAPDAARDRQAYEAVQRVSESSSNLARTRELALGASGMLGHRLLTR